MFVHFKTKKFFLLLIIIEIIEQNLIKSFEKLNLFFELSSLIRKWF